MTQEEKERVISIIDRYRVYYDNIIPNVNYGKIIKAIKEL